ncbi:hypothetical protein M011DRAFT_415795 [Sporormia fimetaria CBS 119925]|uniref:Phospholipid/glycerol acyltransferase domain-containing protein n=1 Tax=Sporormia fimetaria CBS 119925 TaxID=1340428 RepID=A0A6A6VLT2_9PLEO|nr:hypothetical protein M011DRAFT_415795 [Sporormia fimetaria CBS 119925]
MERYTQFRDRGTGIMPFYPVASPERSLLLKPVMLAVFLIKLALVITISLLYFCVLEWVAPPSIKMPVLCALLFCTGVWVVDLRVDGVRRGELSKNPNRRPHPGSIIAANFNSPLDPLYLAAFFGPIFTQSYPDTRLLEPITLFRAICLAFSAPQPKPSNPANLISLSDLQRKHPNAIFCVFPECTTTNGRGILPLSPSLLSADPQRKIFPVSLRYTPADVTTPLPGDVIGWLWRALAPLTHNLAVRVGFAVYNNKSLDQPSNEKAGAAAAKGVGTGYDTNIFDSLDRREGSSDGDVKGATGEEALTEDEQRVLARVGEDLARLGRVKRVALGLETKREFLKLWRKRGH